MMIDKLFSKDILDYKVQTNKCGLVSYVNLDNAATTSPFLSVQKGVDQFLTSYGSVHRGAGEKSRISTDVYEEARNFIKKFVNAPKGSYVVYGPNTTSVINTLAHFFSFLKGKVMVSSVEHSSSWLPWITSEGKKLLSNRQYDAENMHGVNFNIQRLGQSQVVRYEINEGFEFDLENIENILKNEDVKVVVLAASSNLTGYCPDIKNISKIVHKYDAYLVVDACQFLQHHKLDMQELGIDFLVASGHKFYAPYGGGFLIGPKSFFDEFLPYQIGGGNLPYITESGDFLRYKNQMAHDPGTPNAVGVVAMMHAMKQLEELGMYNIEQYEKGLSERLFNYMQSNKRIELFVSRKHLSTVLPFRITGMPSDEVAGRLNDEYGIGVRAGSFCVYHVVRKLLKIEDESEIVRCVREGDTSKVPSLIRASVGLCNSDDDIDRFIEALEKISK